MAYNSCGLIVKICLVKFDTLFTAEIHYAIPEINFSRIFNIGELLTEAKTVINKLRPKGSVTLKTKRRNHDFLPLLQCG